MHIQVNTDRHITAAAELTRQVEATLKNSLDRFGNRITRVEVHLSDENSRKAGSDDKKCVLEARLAGLQPMAVSHQAATLEQAIDGAVGKLERALDSRLGKLNRR